MSDIDPHTREELRTTYVTGRPAVTEVHRVESRPSSAGWIAAGLIAAVAIVAVGFVYYSQNSATNPTSDQLTAASDQGRAQGFAEGVQNATAQNATAGQALASQAAANQAAAQSEADRAAANRKAAEEAANRAQAANAGDNGRDAATTVEAPSAGAPPSN